MKKFLETHAKLKKALDKVDTLCPNIEDNVLVKCTYVDTAGYLVEGMYTTNTEGCTLYKTSNTFRATKDKFGRIVWEEV